MISLSHPLLGNIQRCMKAGGAGMARGIVSGVECRVNVLIISAKISSPPLDV